MTTKEKSIVHISLPDVVMDAMTDGLSDPERAAHNYQQAAIEHSAAATEYEAAKAGSPDEGKAMAKLGNAASKMDGYKRAMAQLGLGDPEGPGRAIFVGGSIGSEIEASGLLDTDKGSKDAFHTVNAGLLRLGYGENAAQGTLFTTTQGPPRQRRTGEIDLRPNTPNDVLDAYTRRGGARPWDTAEVAYFKETITTDAAAERAEGGAVAESAISLSEEKMAIRSIAHSLPVTDEVLADGGATVRMYLDDRLPGSFADGSTVKRLSATTQRRTFKVW